MGSPIVQPGGGALGLNSLLAISALSSGSVAFPRNLIDGGDFTVNPFQRNIPGLATAGVLTTPITNTPTYFADRFFAYGGTSSAVLMALQADTQLPGFSQSLFTYRQAANSNTAIISLGQILETLDTIKLQGQQVTFSFYARAGATFSGFGLQVQIITGTGTNQTAANLQAGSWTNQTNLLNQFQPITAAYARYVFTVTVPTTATQIAVLLSFTPIGTASGSTDGFFLQGVQLEANSMATQFEHRDIEVEYGLAQRYCFVIPEPGANVVVAEGGNNVAANSQVYLIDMPTLMRAAPTVTVSAGTFKMCLGAAAAAVSGFAAGTTHIPSAITLVTTGTQAAGASCQLQGGGGSGYILASADF